MRRADGATLPRPYGWRREREGLLCLSCRRALELVPPAGNSNRARAARRRAERDVKAAHPTWSPERVADYLGLPSPDVGSGKPSPKLDRALALARAEPGISLRELAERAGVSMSTAEQARRRLRAESNDRPVGAR